MKQLCVNCDLMDQASKDKWDKAQYTAEKIDGKVVHTPIEGPPTFDTWKPHCTHESARRQPVTDAVAGTHLDGPPYLTCRERRKQCPVTCRDYVERKENANNDPEL